MKETMKNGLVLEGGGMRGLFSAGVIDEMMEQGIQPDGIVGVSAGATFGCNYKSDQKGRVLRYCLRFRNDPRYMGLYSFLKTGDFVSEEFSYHTIPNELDIFDFQTFENNSMEFHVVCTNVDTGKAIYKKLDTLNGSQIDWLRASASLPIVSKPVCINGVRLLDGGMSDSIPLHYFQEQGFERNIVVLTQPKGFKKNCPKFIEAIRFLLRDTPKIADAMTYRHIMYNQELDYLSEQEQIGNTLLIYPEDTLPIGRIEQNGNKIKQVYQMGREKAKEKMSAIREFYKK